MAFWQEWEWLLWAALGGIAIWVVRGEAYRVRPTGQGRDEG